MSRVLCIGDLHEPVCRKGYLQFCKRIYKKYKCNKVVFMGDVTDSHAISFHAHHPECPGPMDEYKLTYKAIQKWYKAFPNAKVCIGNHDERIVRLAETVDIPAKFLRDYSDMWDTPGWDWDYDHTIDDVYYFHGTGNGGKYPASNVVGKLLRSVVMGHIHQAAGVKWFVNDKERIFGMDIGCGIDDRKFQFAYGKHIKQRSVLACGVVINGIPHHEIMPLEDYKK